MNFRAMIGCVIGLMATSPASAFLQISTDSGGTPIHLSEIPGMPALTIDIPRTGIPFPDSYPGAAGRGETRFYAHRDGAKTSYFCAGVGGTTGGNDIPTKIFCTSIDVDTLTEQNGTRFTEDFDWGSGGSPRTIQIGTKGLPQLCRGIGNRPHNVCAQVRTCPKTKKLGISCVPG